MQADAEAGKATLDELSVLFPQPRTVTVAGRKVEIVPSSIREGTRVLNLALALWTLRQSEDDDELILADEHPAEAVDLLEAATGLDREWLASLSAADKCELALAWMEVNGAFFVLRPLVIRAKMKTAISKMFGVGATSSTPSSNEATPIPVPTHPRARKSISAPEKENMLSTVQSD